MNKKTVTLETCDSTNSVLKRIILSGDEIPFAVISKNQTSGRGRTGKNFFSQNEKGMYASFFFPTNETERLSILTPMTAVAVSRAVEKATLTKCSIKWVNDIFLGGKKVGGILCERIDHEKIKGVIIGIGLNLLQNKTDFPSDIRNFATSLFIETSKKITPDEMFRAVFEEISKLLDDFPNDDGYFGEYAEKSIVTSKEIIFSLNGKEYHGICRGFTREYGLIVETDSGEIILNSNEISLGSRNFIERITEKEDNL